MNGALVMLSLKKSVAREEAVKGAALKEYLHRMEKERLVLESLELCYLHEWRNNQSR